MGKSGQKDVAILDICSSWISHLPKGYTAGRIAGLGMNEEELRANDQLTEYAVQDLNESPRLPYEANSFDAVLNAVSVDYMTKPHSALPGDGEGAQARWNCHHVPQQQVL